MPQDNPNELFWLVDKEDNELGSVSRGEAHATGDKIHRSVQVVLLSSDEHILLQQRSATKDSFPNYWTISASGHVEYSHSYAETAARELAEELGVENIELAPHEKFTMFREIDSEICHIFTGSTSRDLKVNPDPTEVQSTQWLPIADLVDHLSKHSITPHACKTFQSLNLIPQHLYPGEVISSFQVDNTTVQIKTLSPSDLQPLLNYINELSAENTFIRFSGEVITEEEEQEYLTKTIQQNILGEAVKVVVCVGEEIIGHAGIERNTLNKKRSLHVGEFGISVAKKWRGKGVGEKLMKATLDLAKEHIKDLHLFSLSVYAPNERALKLYEKMGFQKVGTLPEFVSYKGKLYDEHLLVKKVADHE